MNKPKMVDKSVAIPEKHIPKLGATTAAAEAAVSAANDAKRIADEKAAEARRALNAHAAVMELVYELVGAPHEATPDFQAGVLRWQEPELTVLTPPAADLPG